MNPFSVSNANSLVVVDNMLFRFTYKGLYKWTDMSQYGVSGWGFTESLLCFWPFEMTSIGTDLYVTSQRGMYLSTDHGRTWGLFPPIDDVKSIPYVCSVGENLIISGYFGVMKSTNRGYNWKKAMTGLPDVYMQYHVLSHGPFLFLDLGGTESLSAGMPQNPGTGTTMRCLRE